MSAPDLARWFDASLNPYMVLDRELRYVAANAAYLEVTGTTREALIGRPIFEVFPHDAADPNNEPRRMLEASLWKVIRTGERDVIAYIPYRVARAPGEAPELRIWSATHTPLLGDDGAVEGVLQHTEDVTHLQRGPASAATVLSRAEQVQRDYVELGARLRGLLATLDQAPGFMALLRGPDHVFDFANRAYQAMVGGRRLVGLPIRDALPDLADQGYFELLDRVYATQEPFVGRGMRVDFRQPGGARYDAAVDFVYQPVLGPDGHPYGVLVQGHDVTERERGMRHDQFRTKASEQLAAAGNDIERALTQVAWAAVETVADWAIVDLFSEGESQRLVVAHADPARRDEARALLRHPLPAAIPGGHPLHGLNDGPRVRDELTRDHLAGIARNPEHLTLLERMDPRSLLAIPLGHAGRLYGVVLLVTGPTRRRFDEGDLGPMAALGRVLATAYDNARLGRERAALLATAQAAQARAEAASRAKDDFLAILGHELRNPLAPILTAVDLVRLRGHATGCERELETIERQARHMVRLVDDMLDVSRVVHGKLELERAPVAPAAVVARAVEMARPAIDDKGHCFEISPAPDRPLLDGDETRLAQVLANLLTNAARYTPPGGHIALTCSVEHDEVVFRVRDDGVGIEPRLIPSMFDMFVQAPEAARRKGGLGLGLTLVKRLVEMHQGSVTAASEGPGCGLEVTVRLSIRHGQAETRDAAPSVEAAERGGHRVVVVDDNVDAADLLAIVLEHAGYVTELSHDGLEALERMVSSPPDVAIVDLGLPGLDGLRLAEQLRQRLGSATPRLIALTGYGGAEDRARSVAAGFEAHLTKPVDLTHLIALLARDDAATPCPARASDLHPDTPLRG